MKRLFIFLSLFYFGSETSFSQCCGGCSPIGGNTNQGTLPKYTLQFNTYYKNAYSEGYMEKDHKSDFTFVKNASSDFVGAQLGYGILNKLTAQIEAGYYLNRTQNFDFYGYKYALKGYGGSSVTLSAKYSLFKDTANDLEFTMGVGVKIPWSNQPQVVDGVTLSEDVQPCNGSYGLVIQSFLFKAFDKSDIRVFMMNTINITGVNDRKYKEGNTYLTALFASKTFLKNWTAIAQVRNEIRDYAYRDNILVASSGGYRFVFVPQINYSIKQKYNISVLYELPIYQYYYGIQLKDQYAFSVNLNIRLGLNKKANAMCAKPM
jgi:hypothetical protein